MPAKPRVDLETLQVELDNLGLETLIENGNLYINTIKQPRKYQQRFVVTDHGHMHFAMRMETDYPFQPHGTLFIHDWLVLDIIRKYLPVSFIPGVSK